MLILDTLLYAEKLQKVGFTPEQAKVQAEQLREIVENDLATKEDIKRLELQIVEVKKDIAEIRKEAGQNQKDIVKWIVGMGLTIMLSTTALLFASIALFKVVMPQEENIGVTTDYQTIFLAESGM
ncbi:MAG: hypothetical protein HQM11_19720 [SAR324 cluster bacterium]|nr:hypothetical protein [SAR324 cluster bacterium]